MTALSTKGEGTSEGEGGGGEGADDQESEDLGVGSQVSHCFSPTSGYTCPTVPLEKNWDNMHENTQNVSILYSTELGVVLLEIFHKISPGASG